MEAFLLLAAKSLLVAGATLLLLKLTQRRSAADRSWIAHLGLVALMLLPLTALALPALEVARPAFLGTQEIQTPASATEPQSSAMAELPSVAGNAVPINQVSDAVAAPVDWLFWVYAAPAVLLLLLTAVALLRLVALKSRANVLVDSHWLQALAHAQRRMGFKNGTALLTSDDLRSPISWGLMRPVILLNSDAANAHDEAEAIIAHELAHIARLDWAKLMLARVATALFWFNPLVWLLAREAHQLREEAADDAVLRADVEDTDYAELLVGIARHESRGLLLGAHGVAPGKGSLARRVRRVLDSALERAPGGWRWSSAAAFVALGMSIPVAAMQFTDPSVGDAPAQVEAPLLAVAPADVASESDGDPSGRHGETNSNHDLDVETHVDSNSDASRDGTFGPQGRVGPDGPLGPQGRVGPDFQIASASNVRRQSAIDRAIGLKAVGATPEYAASIRRAAPHLRLDHDSIIGLAAVGVTPAYVGDLASAGYSRLSADDITGARALGIDGAYLRGMAAAGYGRLPFSRLLGMKAVGITPADVARYRRATGSPPDPDQLISIKALGLSPEELRAADRE